MRAWKVLRVRGACGRVLCTHARLHVCLCVYVRVCLRRCVVGEAFFNGPRVASYCAVFSASLA